MQDFPKINKGQYVLLISNSSTGVVLNTQLETYREDIKNGSIYTVFENINDIEEQIIVLKEKNSDLEFVIYDENKNVIKYVE